MGAGVAGAGVAVGAAVAVAVAVGAFVAVAAVVAVAVGATLGVGTASAASVGVGDALFASICVGMHPARRTAAPIAAARACNFIDEIPYLSRTPVERECTDEVSERSSPGAYPETDEQPSG
ncbi:MAG TPA: hypothetical protein VEU77_11820 [Candidatus Acidoferrales bacterium]|nr:hypothetical protein [Candidatus Acidoferrales bacterium]